MSASFDRTIDNRWRPDLVSSQRRVREEEDDVEREEVIQSRELAFVPANTRPAFEAHDAQTRALITRVIGVEQLRRGPAVAELLEKWGWIDRMKTPEEKQRFLEPLIHAARRDPVENEHVVIFLMLAIEPVRRAVSRAFIRVQAGLQPAERDARWTNRSEARMLNRIAREELYDVTREAALEAVFRYPEPPPPRFFLWLRETIAHRALDKLQGDLPEPKCASVLGAEAEAVQRRLAGFADVEPPSANDRPGLRRWRAQIHLRDVFETVDHLYGYEAVGHVCRQAVGRLPDREREVVDGYFFEGLKVPEIASQGGVSKSTIYNQKASAEKKLLADDCFFVALRELGCVRDAARAEALEERYPNGVLPDGRRIVSIDAAA